jgi:predicted nucleic acid-binding Zn ribbon protein
VSDDDRELPPPSAPVLQFRPRRRRPGKQDDGPAELSDLIMPTLARMGLKTRARHMQLVNLWPGVVGEMVAEHTTVAAFYRGRITVETDSPAMGHALRVQRQDIMDRLNAELGFDLVADIRFKLQGEKP